MADLWQSRGKSDREKFPPLNQAQVRGMRRRRMHRERVRLARHVWRPAKHIFVRKRGPMRANQKSRVAPPGKAFKGTARKIVTNRLRTPATPTSMKIGPSSSAGPKTSRCVVGSGFRRLIGGPLFVV
jgi:hypothetical protein